MQGITNSITQWWNGSPQASQDNASSKKSTKKMEEVQQNYFINPRSKIVKAAVFLFALCSVLEPVATEPVREWEGLAERIPGRRFRNCKEKSAGQSEGWVCSYDENGQSNLRQDADTDTKYLIKPIDGKTKDPRKGINSKQGQNNFLYAKNNFGLSDDLALRVPETKIAYVDFPQEGEYHDKPANMYFLSKFEPDYQSASALVARGRKECNITGYSVEDQVKLRNWMINYIGGEQVLARLLMSELFFGDLVSADNWGVIKNEVTLIDLDYRMGDLAQFLYNAYGINSAAKWNAGMAISLDTLSHMQDLYQDLIELEQASNNNGPHEFLVLNQADHLQLLTLLKQVADKTIARFTGTEHTVEDIECYMQQQHLKIYRHLTAHIRQDKNSMTEMMLQHRIDYYKKNCKTLEE